MLEYVILSLVTKGNQTFFIFIFFLYFFFLIIIQRYKMYSAHY